MGLRDGERMDECLRTDEEREMATPISGIIRLERG